MTRGREISDGLRARKCSPWIKGERVLNIGATEGTFDRELRDKHKEKKWSTLDIEGTPDFKRDLNKPFNLRERFDTIIVGEVIEHVENPTKLIKDVRRHLKNGGRMILTTPNATGIQYIRNPSWCVDKRSYGGHLQSFTPPMIESMMKGFRVIYSGYINAFWLNHNPLQVIPLLFNRLKTDILIVGEKTNWKSLYN